MNQPLAYPLRAKPVPVLPVARMVLGKPVDEVAALLPRLFNLCRVAQGVAVRAALGLELESGWQEALRQEILREHVAKLCLKWPALMSRPAVALPKDWMTGSDAARQALFGCHAGMPHSIEDLRDFLAQDTSIAPILRAISDLFQPGEGCRSTLPHVGPDTVFSDDVQENSVAARRADHPVLRHIAATHGRGPMWQALAVAFELDALLAGERPRLWWLENGAIVEAARGLYGITAIVQDGHVAAFTRITPTDHLTARGGALDQSLASLPAGRAQALAPLLLSILDPCYPVSVESAQQREPEHA
ncbi:hydrogenase expression/formation protein HupK [Marivita sp. XM-24bin2]|jgi:hypothetical protein|uniref:hydrogenase expression/formation protein HupK n=1 Tax=unclassified Marivita TaxID=2632480 RepID=UPI000D792BDF|nr:hydrogenase expression/formation protein HupK [Marivita sp. XM-24bin2]MCR9107370.1 hydrogenase expression/formation protein HupK [Paracoccaceae bacterium]PWL36512.1 MAG: hydrogenase expression/formation protein HupK [Marivita sp. XM-24bin2]